MFQTGKSYIGEDADGSGGGERVVGVFGKTSGFPGTTSLNSPRWCAI